MIEIEKIHCDIVAQCSVYIPKKRLIYNIVKRTLDFILSLIAVLGLILPFLIIAICIKLEDCGPILYKAERIGKNDKPFHMYKFRSMKVNAERLENFLSEEEMIEYKKEYKLKNDCRITKIGRILRKCSADELPQLFNILKGDMSIVGPRPVLDEETRLYGVNRDYLLSVKPGLTGFWQAYARNDVGYEDGKRQNMELEYVSSRSLLFDLRIIFATVKRVITRNGAF